MEKKILKKMLVMLFLLLGGCKSSTMNPDFFEPITDDELSEALNTIEALSPNSRISKVVTIRPGGEIKSCSVAVSMGEKLKHYIVTSTGIYEYDPNTGKRGRLLE